MSPRRPDPASPRPLDRALSLPLLETVHRIASLDVSAAERSEQLTIALREHTTDADAKTRVKHTVMRIWISPPEPAARAIRWAIDHPEHFPDRRLMHTGALLATVPFVGSALQELGRSFALAESLTVPDLRRRLVARWGETSTVLEATGKTVTSLRRLGVVNGGGRQPVNREPALASSQLGAAWLVHTLMLHRSIASIDMRDASTAPELFWAGPQDPDPSYPHLEPHSEGLNRRIWVSAQAGAAS